MPKAGFTIDDMCKVLERKGYTIESYPTRVGKGKRVQEVLYALLPNRIYGLGRTYCPENTAEAVFSRILHSKTQMTKEDFLDSL